MWCGRRAWEEGGKGRKSRSSRMAPGRIWGKKDHFRQSTFGCSRIHLFARSLNSIQTHGFDMGEFISEINEDLSGFIQNHWVFPEPLWGLESRKAPEVIPALFPELSVLSGV